MAGQIKFGTDGWRAVIAEDFTFENVRVCAQAVASLLKSTVRGTPRVSIGYDTRFASEDFAAAAAEVLAGNGIHTYLCKTFTPTPVLSHSVVDLKADGGIVITASHNPGRYNGFKYKSPDGSSAPTEVIGQLEGHIAEVIRSGASSIHRMPMEEAAAKGLVEEHDPNTQYLAAIRRLVDVDALASMKGLVVVDSMYGAGAGYIKGLLSGGEVQVEELNSERNPEFPGIRPEPIGHNLAKLETRVRESDALLGIATDGDADRVGIVDENGVFLNQLQVFALLCLYLLQVRQQRGAIIRSVTTSEMISLLGKKFNVPVYVTPVGFKYVAPLMLEHDALIGGEESGGYGFRGHIPERDGILAGLYFLDMVRQTGKPPSRLLQDLYDMVGPHYYDRADVELDPGDKSRLKDAIANLKPDSVGGSPVEQVDTTDGVRLVLKDGSWILFRLSGTEPLLRIYVETDSEERVPTLIAEGARLVGVQTG
jgi:alpha-D-glucose phosphate-specific phosphoglucomutase